MDNSRFKFRAFCNGEMLETATIQHMIHQTVSTCSMDMLENDFIFMQFTGLTDKNGVDIYESHEINKTLSGLIEAIISDTTTSLFPTFIVPIPARFELNSFL